MSYTSTLSDDIKEMNGEPRKVVVKIYGKRGNEEGKNVRLNDMIICLLMSERKLGAPIHGFFEGGQIEEFVLVSQH